jgi:hypothetical protein
MGAKKRVKIRCIRVKLNIENAVMSLGTRPRGLMHVLGAMEYYLQSVLCSVSYEIQYHPLEYGFK